ncbi:MAG: DUF1295 domain-containing protein [Acidobacteriota bacterium]|nr:DUF1295 domain-containing protein [Acidobacteriota bacterium]
MARAMFRWRSYAPLVAIAGLCLGLARGRAAAPGRVGGWVAAGLALAALGLALRLYCVGYAPAGTSGRHRRQYAAALNTFGIYSVVRHPLYLGNVLVWAGASLTSGWPAGAAVSALLGAAVFGAIARHEDAFLRERFGAGFEEWSRVTPAFLPRPALWRTARRPFDWGRAVASEYSTLHTLGILALLFAALRATAASGAAPGPWWWAGLALNTGLYGALRVWRRRARPAS